MRPPPGGLDLAFHADEPRDPATGRWVHLITRSGGGYVSHSVALLGANDDPLALVTWSNQGNNRHAVNALWVDPAHRRKGLGTAVLKKAREVEPRLEDSEERSDAGDAFLRASGAKLAKRKKRESAKDAEALGRQAATIIKAQVSGSSAFIAPEVINLSNIDLASHRVKVRPEVKHIVPAPVDTDATVRAIADILLSSARFERVRSDYATEVAGLEHLLAPYGIRRTAIRMALGLTHKEGGGRRGTAHVPNARLAEHGATLDAQVRDVRDYDVYFRAAYLANAAQRMQRDMNAGATQQEALRHEAPYYRMHEEARRGRLKAVAQVQTAAKMYGLPEERGHLVGWYLNPLLHNEVECITANGHNFYAEEGTSIGLPGSVHNRCGCYAGPPWEGATLVNDAVKNVVAFKRSRPKFKLKERRTA